MQHDDQKRQHDGDVQQQGRRLDDLVGGLAQRAQDDAEQLRQERALAVRQRAVVDRRPADEHVGQDDVEDHEQHQPGAAGVRTVEPRLAAVLLGLGAEPDDRERHDAEEDGGREEVLQEAQRIPTADDRDVEVRLEQEPVRLDVDRQQDEETPHREEVRQAGKRPLQQAPLPEDLGDLRPDSLAGVIGMPRGGLSGRDQLEQPQHAAGGECGHDQRHAHAHYQSDEHLRRHRRSPQCIVDSACDLFACLALLIVTSPQLPPRERLP